MTDTLRMRWSKRHGDFLIDYPSSPDGWLISDALSPALQRELKERGYDLTTLRFSIKRMPREEPT